jgi:hypothetical protein
MLRQKGGSKPQSKCLNALYPPGTWCVQILCSAFKLKNKWSLFNYLENRVMLPDPVFNLNADLIPFIGH